ncbi:S24 family peptidase [Elioraea tepidiphila]|jgi:SOS-response transcriptional repressor LexA|uniref:S24 family peptidase n=1 Tax=Elioraea tepidiphila TaxID=457934 RepID=UPI00036BD686|nr:S24 family peptidase [Elioraea tepidiphila]
MTLDPIRLRLLKLIQLKKTDLKNASLAIGRNPAYLQQFLYRGTPKVLPEDVRESLGAVLGVSPDDLRHPVTRMLKRPLASPDRRGPPGAAKSARTGRLWEKRIEVPEGFTSVPEIDVRASAGAGALHDGPESIAGAWLFPEPMLRHELRVRPGDLRVITIQGDSMEPLLASGDRILVDLSQRVPAPPGIFVIWDGLGVVAKRVEHVPDVDPPTLRLSSVNPAYQSYERSAEEVNVIGRVIWVARRM